MHTKKNNWEYARLRMPCTCNRSRGFTIGKEKILLAEVLEQGGDRNIGLRIPEDFIIEARRL